MQVNINGYRLDFKPGDPCYYSVDDYNNALLSGYANADVYPLHNSPQQGCSQQVEVYKGEYWIQPRYVYTKDISGYMPLYRGALVSRGTVDELVAYAFPSHAEDRLMDERPDLYVAI